MSNLIINLSFLTGTTHDYHKDPKFSDRQVWANSIDPDQEQAYPGLQFAIWTHCTLKQHCLIKFRIITAVFLEIFTVWYMSAMSLPKFCSVKFL